MASVTASVMQRLMRKPRLLRLIFGVLRRFRPILKIRNAVLILRHEDVTEIFERDDDFTLAEVMAPRMACGRFLLGMDRSPQYEAERGLLREVCLPDDLDRVAELAGRFCDQQLDTARAQGRLDLVRDIAEYVPRNIVAEYFGVPGPNQHDMAIWQRKLASLIVDPSPDTSGLKAEAARYAEALNGYLDDLIEERLQQLRGPGKPPDNVLNRLLRLHLTPSREIGKDVVKRNIAGLCVTGTAPVTKAMTLLVYQLLSMPDAREGVRAAARAADVEAVKHFAFEALRFNPLFPIQPRICPHNTVIRANKPGATPIRGGSKIMLATLSAMFDGEAYYLPDRFKPGRAIGGYLHFGHGMHECFGRQIAEAQIPMTVMKLMRLPNLRRASRGKARIRYDGPAVIGLPLEFDPEAPA